MHRIGIVVGSEISDDEIMRNSLGFKPGCWLCVSLEKGRGEEGG